MAGSSSHPALREDSPICSQAPPICRKQPSSPTGGLPALQEAPHTAAKHPNQQPNTPTQQPTTPTQQPSTPTPSPKPLTRRRQSSETTE